MGSVCAALHEIVRRGTRHSFPFDKCRLPGNGIYILFEVGELGHGGHRIVRVGTHTGENQLASRLSQHFVVENKDRSIFRKNVGRALLNSAHDPFLTQWELDLTTREARSRYGDSVDHVKQKAVEAEVSRYIQQNCTFVALRVDEKVLRLDLESRMIATVSSCRECGPSNGWLGLTSPKSRIRESGLWLVNELHKEPLRASDLEQLRGILT